MSMQDSTFNLNDLVMHCREGLSTIVDTKVMGDQEYFLVKANHGSGETIYVPKNRSTAIVRHLMSESEADDILRYAKTIEKDFNSNTKQRRDDFKRRIASGNILDIVYLVKQLYLYQTAEQLPEKVKFGPVDFDILESAKNMLLDELAITYDVDREKVTDYIDKKMAELAKNM